MALEDRGHRALAAGRGQADEVCVGCHAQRDRRRARSPDPELRVSPWHLWRCAGAADGRGEIRHWSRHTISRCGFRAALERNRHDETWHRKTELSARTRETCASSSERAGSSRSAIAASRTWVGRRCDRTSGPVRGALNHVCPGPEDVECIAIAWSSEHPPPWPAKLHGDLLEHPSFAGQTISTGGDRRRGGQGHRPRSVLLKQSRPGGRLRGGGRQLRCEHPHRARRRALRAGDGDVRDTRSTR